MEINDEYMQNVRELYNRMGCIWRNNDDWHYYTKTQIDKFIKRYARTTANSLVLNAGSGGTKYDYTDGIFTHLDIAEKRIESLPNHIIASVEKIPVSDNTFDCVICVGSVLNYTRAQLTIDELSRVLKPGGQLILEYERSNSGGLIFTGQHNKDCAFRKYMYNDAEHGIWLYSDKLIDALLSSSNMHIENQRRFHILSSVAERANCKNGPSLAIHTDMIMRPFSYYLAHNRIISARKSFL